MNAVDYSLLQQLEKRFYNIYKYKPGQAVWTISKLQLTLAIHP